MPAAVPAIAGLHSAAEQHKAVAEFEEPVAEQEVGIVARGTDIVAVDTAAARQMQLFAETPDPVLTRAVNAEPDSEPR